jgi:amino acid transporter
MFAWGFDRIVPLKVAEVSDRFHTPVVALALVFIGAEATLLGFAFMHGVVATFQASVFLIGQLSLLLVGVAGVIFPYVKKQLYQTSPAKILVAGIPLMVICGAVTVLGELGTLLIYFFYPTLGLPDFKTTAAVLLTPLAIGAAIYLVAKYVRSSQGIDLGAIYREIPPD